MHRGIDILEYLIFSFARSKLLYRIKRIYFYINFYWTVEGQLDNLIESQLVKLR